MKQDYLAKRARDQSHKDLTTGSQILDTIFEARLDHSCILPFFTFNFKLEGTIITINYINNLLLTIVATT